MTAARERTKRVKQIEAVADELAAKRNGQQANGKLHPKQAGAVWFVPPKELQLHPEYDRVPPMRTTEYQDFLADVKERGIRVPLEVQPRTKIILDGRCRLQAALELRAAVVPVRNAPLFGDDPVIYMLRQASKRRQLSDDQRAALAEEEREWLAKEGAERSRKNVAESGPGRGHKTHDLHHRVKSLRRASGAASADRDQNERDAATRSFSKRSVARETAARAHHVSERKVRQAQLVKRADPKLHEMVKRGDVPLSLAVRTVERKQRAQEIEEKAIAAEQAVAELKAAGELPWQLKHGDCLDVLSHLRVRAKLIFADPPYNLGVDYGDGEHEDRLADDDYVRWCQKWIERSKNRLTSDGSLWVLICDEYAGEIAVSLKQAGLRIRAWIKWYETFGVNRANNFNRCSRHLFYTVLDPKQFTFNACAVNRPSDRQTKYGDSRADPNGKTLDDVWQIPRLVGTARERLPDFPTQLPLELLRRVVGCASDPGDLVLDPFAGSATTGIAAIEAGRRFIGIEQQKRFVELAEQRLKAHHAE